jgi:hypothetical protein
MVKRLPGSVEVGLSPQLEAYQRPELAGSAVVPEVLSFQHARHRGLIQPATPLSTAIE